MPTRRTVITLDEAADILLRHFNGAGSARVLPMFNNSPMAHGQGKDLSVGIACLLTGFVIEHTEPTFLPDEDQDKVKKLLE